MNICASRGSNRGLGGIDVFVMIVTFALGAFVLLAYPFRSTGCKTDSRRISCVFNLKQVGLAARMWANDNNDRFAWQVSAAATGSLEFALSGDIAKILLPMTNGLNSPKILWCPRDEKRTVAADFATLRNKNISYFIGLDADETLPQTILAGDRNISGGVMLSNRVMLVSSSSNLVFGSDIHNCSGNVALGDGSAQQVNITGLRRQVLAQQVSASNQVVRWAFP